MRRLAGVEGAVVTPQNQSPSTRVLARGSRSRRALQVGVAGAVALSASIVVPAALAQSEPDTTAVASAVINTSTSIAPTTTTTTRVPERATTTTVSAPVVTTPPPPPAPTPEELAQASLASATPEERLAFQLYVMTNAERAAFAAYLSPPLPPAPAPAPEPEYVVEYVEQVPSAEAPPVANGDVWDRLAQCEANGDWHINTGNGYSGGLQFHPGTWLASGGGQYAPQAYLATREQQIAVAENVLAAAGGRFTPWPGCRAKLGLP